MLKKIIPVALLMTSLTSYASTDGHTSNWLKFLNSNAQYIDPCDGYRNRVKSHFEKSVKITNQTGPIPINKIINTYLLSDMKYRQDEDEFMKAKYPEWWKIANNGKNTRYYNDRSFSYVRYSVGRVGYPRMVNLGSKSTRSLLLDKPQSGYLTLTLYMNVELRGKLWLHNHDGYDYERALKSNYSDDMRVMYHWEASPQNTWMTFETPRSYYRCPMEHPLWNTPKWEVMMNCVENGICSAQIHTNIR